MAGVGQMRSKAQFVKNVPTPAGAGMKDNYVALLSGWGNLKKKGGGRTLEAGELVINKTYEFLCRFSNALNDGMDNGVLLVIEDNTYTINDYWKDEERNFYYKFNLNKSEEQITVSSGSGESIPTEMASVTLTASANAQTSHAYPTNYIILSGASGEVDYTINPVTHDEKTFIITCVDATHRVRVLPSSGTINGGTEYEMFAWEGKSFYCTDGNIITLS